LAGCGGDGDGTASPTDDHTPTPTGTADPTTVTETATPTAGSPNTASPTPTSETFYTVDSQQEWDAATGATEGVTVEDGVLSPTGDAGGSFELLTLSTQKPRNLRLRVYETPLWGPWTFQSELREFTDGQAAGTNDTVMFVDMDDEYPYTMSALDTDGDPVHKWWRSKDFQEWEQICAYDDHPTDEWGAGTNYQWGQVAPDGQFRIYSSFNDDVTTLWEGPDVCNLERIGEVHPNPDSGGFYEPDTDTWHLYYEAEGEVPYDGGPTSNALGHSTSTSGLDNWEDRGNIVDLSEFDEHTGDPEVIQVGDTYFMFIDWSVDHPDYRQAVMTSSDLYDWELHGQVTFEEGGDFTVRYIPDRSDFVALAEFGPNGGVSVFTSPGPVSNQLSATLNAGGETHTAENSVEYGIGEDMSQITMTGGSTTDYSSTIDFGVTLQPGQSYTVTIELNNPGTRVEGFELIG
jgi:hypothetical protein